MKTRIEIVDVEGEPLNLELLADGVQINGARVRGFRREGDEIVVTLEYLHGIIPCTHSVSYGTARLVCGGLLDEQGRCEMENMHVD